MTKDEVIMDKWKCFNCGEDFEVQRGLRPLMCENPNCGKKGPFQALSGPFIFFRGKEFIPLLLATKIMETEHFRTMRDSGEIYHYHEGVYHPKGEGAIRAACRTHLEALGHKHHVAEVVAQIEETTYTDREKFNNPDYDIATENGILNVETGELVPHSPDHLLTIKIPVKFDPEAKCPRIEKFFAEVLIPDQIPVVQEICGYCLYRGYPHQKAVMALGAGENGKSTWLILLTKFLGQSNVASPTLQKLVSNDFASAELYGKLANIHADIPDKSLDSTGTFKLLTGQDLIRGEQKYHDAFTFWNYAKLIYSANELPYTKDRSNAFWRRWLIIKFDNSFPEGDPRRDEHLLEKITAPEEMSGFLNWALIGLHRLLKNGKFSKSQAKDEIQATWIQQTDSLRAFCQSSIEVLVSDPPIFISKADFYNSYVAWCDDQDVKATTKTTVGRRLQTVITKVVPGQTKVDNKRGVHVWNNIRLREEHKVSGVPDTREKDVTTSCENEQSKLYIGGNSLSKKPVYPVQDDGKGSVETGGKCLYCGKGAVKWSVNGTPLCKDCAENYGGEL